MNDQQTLTAPTATAATAPWWKGAVIYQIYPRSFADTNGDGHTLNGDVGTQFDTWRLKYFDWTLDPAGLGDPGAIPRSTYTSPGWSATPGGNDRGFDPPRSVVRGNAWWELWNLFRQRMVWRHNLDVARWMTTSADAAGATVPVTRWYSDQIPADYLFGFTPANPDLRLFASGSPWWAGDISPYGGTGLTAFGFRDRYGNYFPTLPGVFPQVVAQERLCSSYLVGNRAENILALEAVAHRVAGEACCRNFRAAYVALRVFAEQQNTGIGRHEMAVNAGQAAAPEQNVTCLD